MNQYYDELHMVKRVRQEGFQRPAMGMDPIQSIKYRKSHVNQQAGELKFVDMKVSGALPNITDRNKL